MRSTMTIDPKDQPVFKLGIDASSCRFEIRLNDVPILTSILAIGFFMAACLGVIWWIFRTGWRIRE